MSSAQAVGVAKCKVTQFPNPSIRNVGCMGWCIGQTKDLDVPCLETLRKKAAGGTTLEFGV